MGFFGPEICQKIYDPQLLRDLASFGVSSHGLHIDYDEHVPEGGAAMPYVDGWLGDFDEIYLCDPAGQKVGGGSITYVMSDTSEDATPIVFWESFYSYRGADVIPVAHYDFGIPFHVWSRLSPTAHAFYKSRGKRPSPNKHQK